MQEDVPAGTLAFGMGGITMPPSDLCIFWSLQCRYCRGICTWGRGGSWGEGSGPHKHFHLDAHLPGPSEAWSLLSGATWQQCWKESSGYSSQPHDPGTPKSSLFLHYSRQ